MSDQLKLLSLANLAELDSNLPQDFNAMLAAAVLDCTNRPSIKKPREISVVVKVTPILKQDGTVDDVEINVQVCGKSPAKIIQPIVGRATVNGGVKWSPDSPDCPDQKTIEFDEDVA